MAVRGPPPPSPFAHWFDSPDVVHNDRVFFANGHPLPPARAQTDPLSERSQINIWHPPSGTSSFDPYIDSPPSRQYDLSPRTNLRPSESPPSLLKGSLMDDPAFAGDPYLNPRSWEIQDAAPPPDPSYVIPFARGFGPPQKVPRSLNQGPRDVTKPQPHSQIPHNLQQPVYLESTSGTATSSISSFTHSSQSSPSVSSEKHGDLAYLRDDSSTPSPSYVDSPIDHSAPVSPAASPYEQFSDLGHSSASSTPPSHSASGLHRGRQPTGEVTPAPVAAARKPKPPTAPQPQQERPQQRRRTSSRPPPKDLDSIDELDESNPYGVGLHHNGPYEAITAILAPGAPPQPPDHSKPRTDITRDARGAGPSRLAKKPHRPPSNSAANPLSLNLKPGQILQNSIFQPRPPQPRPVQQTAAAYSQDRDLQTTSSKLNPSYGIVYQQGPPFGLRSNQTMANPSPSHSTDGLLPQEYERGSPANPGSLDSALLRPPPDPQPTPLSRRASVGDYPLPQQDYRSERPPERSAQMPPEARGPHGRPPPLLRPDSFYGASARDRSSIPNPYSPLPTPRQDRSSIPNPYSPPPPHRSSPGSSPLARPRPHSGHFAEAQSTAFLPSSINSAIPPPAHQWSQAPPQPSGPLRYDPSHALQNMNLNRSNPEIRRPAPPSTTSGSQNGPAPRHIPRHLVMPTPLASSEAAPTPPVEPLPRTHLETTVRFAPTPHARLPPPQQTTNTTPFHQTDGGRNLLRKRSAPAAPPSHREQHSGGGGGGVLAFLGFGRAGHKPEMREVRAPPGSKPDMMEVRTVGAPKRANTLQPDVKPRRLLSKRR